MTYDPSIPLSERPIAFTDLETTGLSPLKHEIIEIGAVVVNAGLEVIDEVDIKVLPEHIETAEARALEINGYTPEGWVGAVSLKSALREYKQKTVNAIFAAHNPTFDWPFLSNNFEKVGEGLEMDYHRLDNFSIAWRALKGRGLQKWNQDVLARHLGLAPEEKPHRAINGARKSLEIYKLLMATS